MSAALAPPSSVAPLPGPVVYHDDAPVHINPARLALSGAAARARLPLAAVWLLDEPFVSPDVSASGNRLFVAASAGVEAGRVVVSAPLRWIGSGSSAAIEFGLGVSASASSWAAEPGRLPWVRDSRWPLDWFAPLGEVLAAAGRYFAGPPTPTAELVSLWAVPPAFPTTTPEPRLCVRLTAPLPFGAEITVDTGLAACLVPHLSLFEQAGDQAAAETIRALVRQIICC